MSAAYGTRVCVIGDRTTCAITAGRLATVGHVVHGEAPEQLAKILEEHRVIYLCVDADEVQTAHDGIGDAIRRTVAALRASSATGSGQLVIVHGYVHPGTCDWLRHELYDRADTAYLATYSDRRHGGPVIGADTHELGCRIASLEGVRDNRFTIVSPRTAEVTDLAQRALVAVDYEAAQELAMLLADQGSPPSRAVTVKASCSVKEARPSPQEVEVRSHLVAAKALVSLSELARTPMPVLKSVVRGRDLPSWPLAQVTTARAYLAGLAEDAVESAGPAERLTLNSWPWYSIAKRGLDLLLSGLALTILSPLMALIALLIFLESGRPILFKARRVGSAGRTFEMLKFRSMRSEAPSTAARTVTNGYATRTGRLLRSCSLDELPQFFNVLAGQMSLVGPRPEHAFVVDCYQPWQRERLSVVPGLTGWWQINMRGGGGEQYQHVEHDVWYVRHRSFWLDVRILLRTPLALCRFLPFGGPPSKGQGAGV